MRSEVGAAAPSGAAPAPAPGPTPGADTAVAWALAQLGAPYRWGGEGPDAFDCSGLTLRAWEAAGVRLPHSSRLQCSGRAKVPLAELRAGDLVFYATDTSDPSTVHHVGLVVSPGRMVEAPHTGAVVRTASIYRSGLLPHGTRPG
ncbi:NlpC/P60 family protein [Paenibacillus sp. TRM 82003]|nr:NlpC/P60 family protein [Kineococcus sp. TRM81007]MCI3919263.1 NlpC/P60 family protein [Paenibacillus sp. TRM 82003]